MKKVLSILMFLGLFFRADCMGNWGEKTLKNIFEDGQDSQVRTKLRDIFDNKTTDTNAISDKIKQIIRDVSLKENFIKTIVKNVADALTRSGGLLGLVPYGTKLQFTTLTTFNSIFVQFKQNNSDDFNLIKNLQIKAIINIGTPWPKYNNLEHNENLNIEQSFEKWLEYFNYYANKVKDYNAYNLSDSQKAFCYLSPTYAFKEFEKDTLKKELGDLKQSLPNLKAKLEELDNKLKNLKSTVAAVKK